MITKLIRRFRVWWGRRHDLRRLRREFPELSHLSNHRLEYMVYEDNIVYPEEMEEVE